MERKLILRWLHAAAACIVLMAPGCARGYSVLSHEEVVDMAWKEQIVPLLKARYPAITADDLRQAHAYAYGGSVIQDIGYYPFGSKYFSDLLHYVRPNEFVEALIRDAQTPQEYAFALGALAHFCGDTVGHPIINQVTAQENPPLLRRFGQTVTYAENPTAHLRTEFGFDVVEVAQGHYSQQDYHDFIGFEVTRPLLDRAFRETYGLEVSDILKHEDLAISTYRNAVSNLIPRFTRIAFVSYGDEIQKAAPGTDKQKFIYRLNRTEYRTQFGKEHVHVSFGGRLVALVLHVVPKVGPFKAMKLTLPNAQEQAVCLKSINATVDQYKTYLAQVHAEPMAIPLPGPQDVAAARAAAERVGKDATRVQKEAGKAKDPAQQARMQDEAAKVTLTAQKAERAAERTANRAADQGEAKASPPSAGGSSDALPQAGPSPVAPVLPELDMDTGKPVGVGEYPLADEAYAHLLNDLVKAGGRTDAGAPIAEDIVRFFGQATPPTGLAVSAREASRRDQRMRQVNADLATLKTLPARNVAATK